MKASNIKKQMWRIIIPDSDGVPVTWKKFFHIQKPSDFFKNESHIRIQVIQSSNFIIHTDCRRNRVGKGIDHLCTVIVVWKLGQETVTRWW